MHGDRCERCGKVIKQSVHITDDKGQNYILCHDCNNAMVAERLGINNFVDFTMKVIHILYIWSIKIESIMMILIYWKILWRTGN